MQSATMPSPLSTRASITTPSALASSSALRSMTSDWRTRPSIKSSKPSPVIPLTGKSCAGGPNSDLSSEGIPSVKIPCSRSWFSIIILLSSIFTPGLSIFVMATTSEIDPGWALAMDLYVSIISIVCGETPSSAATTRTIMSAPEEPDRRIDLNAA